MANSVLTLVDATNRYVARFFGDTSEAQTLKIDPGALKYALNANGMIMGAATDRLKCYSLYLRRIMYDVQPGDTKGFLRISTNGDGPNTVWTLSSSGDIRFDEGGATCLLNVAATTANTNGNVFFTFATLPGSANSAYSVLLDFRKEPTHYDQGQTADPKAFNR